MSETTDDAQPKTSETPVAGDPIEEPARAASAATEPAGEPEAPAATEPAAVPSRRESALGRRRRGGGGIDARVTAAVAEPAATPLFGDFAVADAARADAPAADDDDRGASEWTLRILVAGMMFLLLLCAIFIIIAA